MISFWFLVAGALLLLMALVGSAVDRLPLSPGLIYLLVGVALGPAGLGIVSLDPMGRSPELMLGCEIALVISLFTVGLKLRTSLSDPLWRLPFRLATISMAVVIAAITLVGVYGFGLPLGAAVLLGAILAPTDPVLASDVQVRHANDRDRSRFMLTAEGGMNDGIAFPFVLLGMGLLGLGNLGPFGALACARPRVGGGRRPRHRLAVRQSSRPSGPLCAARIQGSCGLGRLSGAWIDRAELWPFAGVARERFSGGAGGRPCHAPYREKVSRQKQPAPKIAKSEEVTHPTTAPAHMVETVLGFNERFERIGELVVVLALGASLSTVRLDYGGLWLALVLFVVIRPASVLAGLAGASCSRRELKLLSWFGIRGIGSLYYLMYVIEAGPPAELTENSCRWS